MEPASPSPITDHMSRREADRARILREKSLLDDANQNKEKPSPVGEELKRKDAEREEKRAAARNCCMKLLKFFFSNVGLSGMVVLYTVAGGFIFEHLERTNELEECHRARDKYLPAENETVHRLWQACQSYEGGDDDDFALVELHKLVAVFRNKVLDIGYDGKNCTAMDEADGPGYKWNFAGALLFSVTVITTIGYGNIAPKTFWGRLVCIAYATLGIPLMLLCLANLGAVLADLFRFIYTKFCCCGCCRRRPRNNRVESVPSIGSGRKTPEAWKDAYVAERAGPAMVDDVEEEEEDEEDDQKISVPLTITMAIIGGYIFLGALLFGVWEDWDALKASYFCFVTISTIGFGDVVPGAANFQTSADQWKMVGAAVYMLFGMAILSMCFSLIQEEIAAKFHWIGRKVGLVQRDEDEIDGDNKAGVEKEGGREECREGRAGQKEQNKQ